MTIYKCNQCKPHDRSACILDTVEDMSGYAAPTYCPYESDNEPVWVRQEKELKVAIEECGGCGGKGFTQAPDGFNDTCTNCNGTGKVALSMEEQDTKDQQAIDDLRNEEY